jgi:hypothetical protein
VEVLQPNGKLMGANKGSDQNPKHMSRLCSKALRPVEGGDVQQYYAVLERWEKDKALQWPHKRSK